MTAVPAAASASTTVLAALGRLQDDDGCFPSSIRHRHGRTTPDRNGFVTALVLRSLRHTPRSPSWRSLAARALTWLERCRSSSLAGAFCFWPETARPSWAAAVPPDADDTAVITTELLRHGRLGRAAALRTACRVLVPHRVAGLDRGGRPAWVAPGSFLTWLAPANPGAPRVANPVDCCVNANVAALLAFLDATHLPGYDAAVATVRQGLEWAGEDPVRRSALTPFYPDARSLAEALEHAVESGTEPLREAWQHASTLPPPPTAEPPGCFRSAYGGTVWYATALDLVRSAAAAHEEEASRVSHR
jgi:hypothetical protein